MPVIKGLEWTFDTNAQMYEKMRPGYADDLYRKIFAYCPAGKNAAAVEIGIGGGQATEPVLKEGFSVTAVERGEHFTAICREKFKAYPGFRCINQRFEDFETPDGSVDLVFAASSFHWIDEAYGYKKVYAMLKSGGAFARFANHPYKDKSQNELDAEIQKSYVKYMPTSKMSPEYTMEDAVSRARIGEKYGFTDIEAHIFKRVRTFTASEYILLLGTYSDHIAIEEQTRKRFFSEIENTINAFGGVIHIYDTMDLALMRKP